MKIIKLRVVPIFLTCLLLTNVSFASSHDTYWIEHDCVRAAGQLHDLIQSKPDDICAGDLEMASAYIEATALKLQHNKIEQALTAIKYGELELKEISTNRSYCASFASSVKPVLAAVIRISSEIEVLERLKAQDQTMP